MTVPDEAIEAAVLMLHTFGGLSVPEARERAQVALEVAAPYLRAQALEDAAEDLARLQYARPDHPNRAEYERVLAVRRGNTDTWLRARAAAERGPDV